MTIATAVSRNDYTGNGTAHVFAYSFKIFSESDLLVTVRNTSTNTETTLTLNTDYTVSGVGSASGGNVTTINADEAWSDAQADLKTGYVMTIRRVVDILQETDIKNQGAFYPEIHEDAFDLATMVDLQQQDEIDRSVKLPETVDPTDFDASLPADIVGQSNRLLVVNSSGDGLAVGPTTLTAGLGDVTGPVASVDNEMPLFSGTSGHVIKRASTSGVVGLTAGVMATVPGTAGNWILAGGAGAPPTASNTTTTGKFIDGSADEIQARVQGHSTQTSDILSVEKSDATVLLKVTNTSGTAVRGTTTNDAASAGFVGEQLTASRLRSAATSLTSGNSVNVLASPLSLTAGDWLVTGIVGYPFGVTTSYTELNAGISTTSATLSSGDTLGVSDSSGQMRAVLSSAANVPNNKDITVAIPSHRISVASTTSLYLVANAVFSVSTLSAYGSLTAVRVR